MPRKSPYDVSLGPEERQALESVARKYTSPYCDVVRAKIILLASDGLSNEVIAAQLDTPRQIVQQMAQAVLPHSTAGPGGTASGRA